MPKKRLLAVLLSLLPMLPPASAQDPVGEAFDGLTGDWEGTGTLQGSEVEAEMAWEPVLGGRHVRLLYRVASQGRTLFEGHAYYRPADLTGVWFDSAGHTYRITASLDGGVLVSEWGDPEIEQGRSTYSVEPDGRLTVVDAVYREGDEPVEFARITYYRVPEPPAR